MANTTPKLLKYYFNNLCFAGFHWHAQIPSNSQDWSVHTVQCILTLKITVFWRGLISNPLQKTILKSNFPIWLTKLSASTVLSCTLWPAHSVFCLLSWYKTVLSSLFLNVHSTLLIKFLWHFPSFYNYSGTCFPSQWLPLRIDTMFHTIKKKKRRKESYQLLALLHADKYSKLIFDE